MIKVTTQYTHTAQHKNNRFVCVNTSFLEISMLHTVYPYVVRINRLVCINTLKDKRSKDIVSSSSSVLSQ